MSENIFRVVENYIQLLQKIESIAKSCNRDPKTIKLVAVTKNHLWDDIAPLCEAGCRDFGENRVQEALEKIEMAPNGLSWHFIGTLQKNKIRKVIGRFTMIHSVDTPELAEKISACSVEMGLRTSILLEVNTSGELSKHGLSPDEWMKSYESILKLEAVSVEGLMTMAPLTEDQEVIRNTFRQLRLFRDKLALISPAGQMHHLSMGMTHDYPIAIEEGATLLRIGSAIFA